MTQKAEPSKKEALPKRSYSEKTLKVLFALSGNQCAHPKCMNTLIELATEQSDVHVSAHICHIYAISTDGPRGKSGLTQKELNAPDNLILLCSYHHGIVDGQHESYPAKTLKAWKLAHEAEMQRRLSSNLESVQPEVFSHPYFPTALVDQKIEEDVEALRKTRFFNEFDTTSHAQVLCRRLIEGELSGGTDAARSRALAWCARLLAPKEPTEIIEGYLQLASQLAVCAEIDIAKAFISSQNGNKETALKSLASLDSPMARSAALMVVMHHDGAEGTTDWLQKTEINSDALDSEGKLFLLNLQLELARWDAVEETLGTLSPQDFVNAPALHHTVAIACLVKAVPTELRSLVVEQLPFNAANFPLASDAPAMETRETAHRRFSEAADVERQLNCPGIASLDDEYALWLELKNPRTAEAGLGRLEDMLRDPKSALQLVPLGLHFGINLDITAVEQAIEQNIALNGGVTREAAITRFTLAITQKSPSEVASYIEQHYKDLSRFLEEKSIGALQVEAFSRAGMRNKAEQCLSRLLESGLSEEDEARLRRIIAEATGADPVELRKEQFEQTSSLRDLTALVSELQAHKRWSELYAFGSKLFQKTGSVEDAELVAIALTNSQRSDELVEFLNTLTTLRQQSWKLQMSYCWALFNEGNLLSARSELAKLSDESDDPNYRALTVDLGIAIGDWDSLYTHVTAEYQARNDRSAVELIQAAQLAHHIGSPRAKDLTFAAAAKGDEDPEVLATAYFLATTAGWENDEKVTPWVQKAAELSGNQGPLQSMTLKDLADRKPEWDRRESEIWQLLGRGDAPMFLAGEALNRTLVNLMLFPALANLSERDPRRRGAIPAYSGQRRPLPLDAGVTKVGFDPTALLTLSFLDLLDETFEAFETIILPHSTLFWLFEEKQKAAFHQPSQVKDAIKVRNLLATGALEKLVPSPVAYSELAAQVGDDLAILIAEAEKTSQDGESQRIVVRPSPVHRIGSLMKEEADLREHAGVISSCLAIVENLRQKGQITADEESKAQTFLQFHEKPWPEQPDIADGAVLYLDPLSISYLIDLGMLDKLKAAGFTPVASPSKVLDSDALISYSSNADKIIEVIEQIRSILNSRIESGKITIGRQCKFNQPDEKSIAYHPTGGAFALAGVCDAIIIDDRFINQHEHIDEEAGKATVFSTLDILDGLVAKGTITPDQRMEYRTRLRRAGYFFVPVSDEELNQYLSDCSVTDELLNETAELKAIRENLLRVRMCNWLQLPKEALWLDSTIKTFITVMKGLWKPDVDIAKTKVISDWIVDQIDIRGWLHFFSGDVANDTLKTKWGAQIMLLLTPPLDVTEQIMDAYWEWVEGRVWAQIEEQFPDIYDWIVGRQKQGISKLADMSLEE